MRILVILRQVYERKSIHWDYENHDFINRKATVNQADLMALQWAADYSGQNGASIDACILTEEEYQKAVLDKLDRFPLKRCIQIAKSGNEQADVRYITESVERDVYDLIVSGDETEDEHNSFLLPLLGYSLNMNVLTAIHKIEVMDSERLLAYRKEERGATQVFEIKLPAALSVTSQISKMRYGRHPKTEIKITKKDRVLPTGSLQRRIGPPEPNIIFGSVPVEENPLHRLMNVMGFSDNSDAGLSQQTTALSEDHLHFSAERLMKWLKE